MPTRLGGNVNWFTTALKKYAVFSGRSRRSEYWYFILFYFIIYIALAFVDRVTGTFDPKSGIGLLTAIFALALLIPSLSVSVRILHDTDRSGWWRLTGFIPLSRAIVLIRLLPQNSLPATNRIRP